MGVFIKHNESFKQKHLIFFYEKGLLPSKVGTRFWSIVLKIVGQSITSTEVSPTSLSAVASVDQIQIASASDLWALKSSKDCLKSTLRLCLQFVDFLSVKGKNKAEPSCIRNPLLHLFDLAVYKCTEPLSQSSLD